MIHILGRLELDSTQCHHRSWNRVQFKFDEFISRHFHLIFPDNSLPRIIETVERKITDEGGLL